MHAELNNWDGGAASLLDYYGRGLQTGEALAYQQVVALLPWLVDEFADEQGPESAEARRWAEGFIRFLRRRKTGEVLHATAEQADGSGI